MRFGRLKRYLKTVTISFVTALALCLPGLPVSAAATAAIVSVSTPAQPVGPGAQFTVSVMVQPNNAIAGAQFYLSFNPALVTVNNIREGDLLNQNGEPTYFLPGQIDNHAGTISGVAGTITDPGQTVSTPGTLAIITMTAGSTAGTSALTLSNVIVGDLQAQAVLVNTVDGNIVISSGGGGGGGGSGGGGGVMPPAPNITNSAVGTDGVFSQTVTVKSDDSAAQVTVDQGTKGLTSAGLAIGQMAVTAAQSPPAPPEQSNIIGSVYEFGPAGATFDHPVDLTFIYNRASLPSDVAENDLVVATWDAVSGRWSDLPSTINPPESTVTARVNHFSVYCVMAHARPAAVVVIEPSVPPEEPAQTTVVTNEPDVSPTEVNKVSPTEPNGEEAVTPPETTVPSAPTSTADVNALTPTLDVSEPSQPTTTPPAAIPPPPAVREFSLSLLAEIVGGALVLIAATVFFVVRRRRQLLKRA